MRFAIIGAGIAGLSCAAGLKARGIQSVLFDKGKRPGGRLSTLRLGNQSWDFGAQYVTAGQGTFAAQVETWQRNGVLTTWTGGPTGALVGTPTMASLVEAQCAELDVRFGALIQRIEGDGQTWRLSGPGLCEGPFAGIILAVPAEQAAPLLSLHDLTMAREVAAARSRSCWSVMAGFNMPLADLPDYLAGLGSIAWAARNNSKPGRVGGESWVIQAGADWSQQNLERDRGDVARHLLNLFRDETGANLPEPNFLKAHRWRFAFAYGQAGRTLWNDRLRLGACGDWCHRGQIEAAWQSGADLAGRAGASLLAQGLGQERLNC